MICLETFLAITFMLVGVGYFAAEMINLLKAEDYQPLNVQLAIQAAFSGQDTKNWQITTNIPQAVLILISVCLWVLFLLLGIMGIYMR